MTTLVFAQDHDGRLTGQVTGPFDGLDADAPLRATHIASGDSWQSRTDTVGRNEFVNLPAGITLADGCEMTGNSSRYK